MSFIYIVIFFALLYFGLSKFIYPLLPFNINYILYDAVIFLALLIPYTLHKKLKK